MINITQAIYQLYPNVVRTEDNIAYDADGNEVVYDVSAVTEQAEKTDCSEQAKTRIAATDWSQLPDVGLKNAADYVTYRGVLRGLILTPVANPVWPTEPTPVWE